MADDALATPAAPDTPAKPHSLTCQRCSTAMDLRDPEPGTPWAPQQFWVCPRCARHFWTTHPAATVAPPKPPAAAGAKPAAAAKPAAPKAAVPAEAPAAVPDAAPAPATAPAPAPSTPPPGAES